jgi:hypothetical protein
MVKPLLREHAPSGACSQQRPSSGAALIRLPTDGRGDRDANAGIALLEQHEQLEHRAHRDVERRFVHGIDGPEQHQREVDGGELGVLPHPLPTIFSPP